MVPTKVICFDDFADYCWCFVLMIIIFDNRTNEVTLVLFILEVCVEIDDTGHFISTLRSNTQYSK